MKGSVKTLLTDAIDYAGLFPPAGLSMPEAVINYAMYRNSNFAWMLGRFVVPAARLDEFIESAGDFISADPESVWRLSVIAGDDLDDTFRRVDDFNLHYRPGAAVDSLEIRIHTASEIANAVGATPSGIAAYYETGLGENFPELAAELALTGQRAKIRTGGVTADAFPRTDEVVRFVRTCLAANVPFKATAGLHHPVRCFRPLTYENDAPKGTMHGFLNLFLMTGFARTGFRPPFLEDIMEDEFEEVFQFDKQLATWREDYSLNIREIQNLRKFGIQSFGSCSFDEPVAELQKLGML